MVVLDRKIALVLTVLLIVHLLLVKIHLSHFYEITFGEKIRKQPSQDEVLPKSSKFRKQIICAFHWKLS